MLPGFENLLFAHSSWYTYAATMRIYKHWDFRVAEPHTATGKLSFSSYPGTYVARNSSEVTRRNLKLLQCFQLNVVFPGHIFHMMLCICEDFERQLAFLPRFPGVSGRLLPLGQWSDDDPDHQQRLQLLPFWQHDPQQPAGVAEGQAGSQFGTYRRGVGQNLLQVQLWWAIMYLYGTEHSHKLLYKTAETLRDIQVQHKPKGQ